MDARGPRARAPARARPPLPRFPGGPAPGSYIQCQPIPEKFCRNFRNLAPGPCRVSRETITPKTTPISQLTRSPDRVMAGAPSPLSAKRQGPCATMHGLGVAPIPPGRTIQGTRSSYEEEAAPAEQAQTVPQRREVLTAPPAPWAKVQPAPTPPVAASSRLPDEGSDTAPPCAASAAGGSRTGSRRGGPRSARPLVGRSASSWSPRISCDAASRCTAGSMGRRASIYSSSRGGFVVWCRWRSRRERDRTAEGSIVRGRTARASTFSPSSSAMS